MLNALFNKIKHVFLFCAAPFIALAYILFLPIYGMGVAIYTALEAKRQRDRDRMAEDT